MRTTRGWASTRRANTGSTFEQSVTVRSGPKQTRVVVSTPCCGVPYHLALDEIDWLVESHRKVWIACGKNRHGRGRVRSALGCEAVWDLNFDEKRPPTTVRWTWTGR